MEGNRGETRDVASVFAQDLVTFGFREHGRFCFLVIRSELWNNRVEIFHRDVGKVVMSFAKSAHVRFLLSSIEDEVPKIMESFPTFALWMTTVWDWCYKEFYSIDGYLSTLLKYFACVIELTVLARSQGLPQTERIAVHAIVGVIMSKEFQRRVTGGVRGLVTDAKDLYRSSMLIRHEYETGQLICWRIPKFNPGVQSSGPVNPGVQSSGPVNPVVQSSGPVNPVVQYSGPVNPVVQASGPVNPVVQASGPVNTDVLHTWTFYPEAQSTVRDNAPAQPAAAYNMAQPAAAYNMAQPAATYNMVQPAAAYNMAQPAATFSDIAYLPGLFSYVTQPTATLNSVPPPTVQDDPESTDLLPVTYNIL